MKLSECCGAMLKLRAVTAEERGLGDEKEAPVHPFDAEDGLPEGEERTVAVQRRINEDVSSGSFEQIRCAGVE